jgi:hypothetical protein
MNTWILSAIFLIYQITLQVLPLPTLGQLFDMSVFWQELLLASTPRDSDSGLESIASEFAYLLEMSKLQVR